MLLKLAKQSKTGKVKTLWSKKMEIGITEY